MTKFQFPLLFMTAAALADGAVQVDLGTSANHIYAPGEQAQIVISPTSGVAIEQVRACVGGNCVPMDALQTGIPGQAVTGRFTIPPVMGFPRNVVIEVDGSGGFHALIQAGMKISSEAKVAQKVPVLSKLKIKQELFNKRDLKFSFDITPGARLAKAVTMQMNGGDDVAVSIQCDNTHCKGSVPREGAGLAPDPTVDITAFDAAGREIEINARADAHADLSKSPPPPVKAIQNQNCDSKNLKFTFQTMASQIDAASSSVHLKANIPTSAAGPFGSVPMLADVASGNIACTPIGICTAIVPLPKTIVSPAKSLVLDLVGKNGAQQSIDLLAPNDPSHGDFTDQASNCVGNIPVSPAPMLSQIGVTPITTGGEQSSPIGSGTTSDRP